MVKWRGLHREKMYNKIYIVVIEPTLSPHMEGEKSWIIDDDLCIIEL